MNIGEKIREFRTRKGLTQEVVADKLKMSLSNYAYIEQGKVNVNIPKLEKIAQILETDIFELLSLGEKNVFYIPQNTKNGVNNGYVINNNLPQELTHEIEKLQIHLNAKDEKISFLETRIKDLEVLLAAYKQK